MNNQRNKKTKPTKNQQTNESNKQQSIGLKTTDKFVWADGSKRTRQTIKHRNEQTKSTNITFYESTKWITNTKNII